ncbi:MAG TPA: tRNA 5-hydroxyuridine modification protein YegQ [Candidatus Thiothrix moscowensis]|uniref:prephenate-dependent tRNA uridine(34) hydroxylase TrhP n=1 Tax=unclassified Thiothrix TaxID=2636184 RepID=UPI0025E0EE3D|nr:MULTISPECIES: tRNA 5-hydroxyuridine modification protein YegQ [unclassified Thiothrix]HRJ51811.1 tRNA 5-hydroxyuridine modification protein YegQ [Candidatus Thiothrix moscowensis]HRJ92126.1 tRNA 5-hydroxyuridine modification protein YegQ [Candidatus Thiothrix moscowensis]
MKRPELLAPAGTLKAMRHAFAYGADAVYAGQPRYSLRVRNNEFKNDNLAIGIAEAHALGKQFFVAVNISPHNSKIKTFLADLEPVIAMNPDALIMADPGLIMLVRERWPDMPVHLSVQANTVNYATVKFWQNLGLTRVILSRELSLEEIAEIRQQCPEMELEVFVHGALCIAYSGRCLLSGYFNHRDPNQGTCTNACRWEYKTTAATEAAEGKFVPKEAILPMDALRPSPLAEEGLGMGGQQRHPLADQVYFLEEANRPGELMPVFEDEHGTYIMNSKDLRAIEHVQKLTEIGVDCLKIEGRTKSHYYVARTAQAYKQAIDDTLAGRPFDPKLLGILENLANRGYTDGFYERHHTHEYQNYIQGASMGHQQQFVAEAMRVDRENAWVELDVKNRFSVGDRLEFVLPDGNNRELILDSMQNLQGEEIPVAPGSGHKVRIPLPPGVDSDMILISRFL